MEFRAIGLPLLGFALGYAATRAKLHRLPRARTAPPAQTSRAQLGSNWLGKATLALSAFEHPDSARVSVR
jgi:hypothetical protein